MEFNTQGLTLRDGSHGKSHSNLEIVDSTADPGASMDGVIEMANVDYPHSHTDERDDLADKQSDLWHISRSFVLSTQFSVLSHVINTKH